MKTLTLDELKDTCRVLAIEQKQNPLCFVAIDDVKKRLRTSHTVMLRALRTYCSSDGSVVSLRLAQAPGAYRGKPRYEIHGFRYVFLATID